MNICELKRFATDWAYAQGFPSDEEFKPVAQLNKNVAIIGAGPSGLTCAYYLARLGYHVDVYEAENRPGGIMTYGDSGLPPAPEYH
ncbi:MAG: FAD-dependent oxidoreductase [Evtepia gabavorous]